MLTVRVVSEMGGWEGGLGMGGVWQAISDVMPAAPRWQLNLFSEIPRNVYL